MVTETDVGLMTNAAEDGVVESRSATRTTRLIFFGLLTFAWGCGILNKFNNHCSSVNPTVLSSLTHPLTERIESARTVVDVPIDLEDTDESFTIDSPVMPSLLRL